MKKNVVIGFFGSQKDRGAKPSRWERWRPTLSLCAQPDFPVHQLHLILTNDAHRSLTTTLLADIALKSPHTEVIMHSLPMVDPWDFEEVAATLYDFAQTFEFDVVRNDYFVHLSTGTHEAQYILGRLAESRHIPAKMVDSLQGRNPDIEPWRGEVRFIDPNLAIYDKLFSRFKIERLGTESLLKGGIPTRNAEFNDTITRVEKVALRSDAAVLLMGKTGTGKSILAKRIFELRQRRHLVTGAFVDVNCATLDREMANSVLFGHKKGSFTGAVSDHEGLLKAADKGILFLDEIGHLPLEVQAKLLNALETKASRPLGGKELVHSDFMLIAGTNRDLRVEVEEGRFLEDLYARIDVWQFKLPTLAERWEDIEPNLEFELELAGAKRQCFPSFSPAAKEKFLAFAIKAPWPGNFRDLSASVDRMVTMADGGRIQPNDVDDEIARLLARWPRMGGAPCAEQEKAGTAPMALGEPHGLVAKVLPGVEMDVFEQAQLEAVLRAVRETSSMAEAGRRLFAVSRTERKSVNDTARVRAALASRGLDYHAVKAKLLAA